jgi:hypothetical protein
MDSAISKILRYSIAVENGFLAAGATITVVALVQSVVIVFGWLA